MKRNPNCVLNGVGDDWQSINAFMGAEPSLFKTLKSSYPASLNLALQSNWRCGKRIVELGNRVMKADEKVAAVPAVSHDGRVRVLVGGIEETQWTSDWHPQSKDYLARQIDRMAQAAWADDARAKRDPGSIVVLAFSNKVFGEELSFYAGLIDRSDGGVVEYSTVHSSKGIEWDHVILIDAIASNYPARHAAVPIQQDVFTSAARKAEAQRLLYVAVTRAKYSVGIMAPTELHPKLNAALEIGRR
jgi:superfamily I DNA/RNA helicase